MAILTICMTFCRMSCVIDMSLLYGHYCNVRLFTSAVYFLPNKGCRYLAVFKVMVWVYVVYCEHVRVPLARPDTDRSSHVLSGSAMVVDRHTCCQALPWW